MSKKHLFWLLCQLLCLCAKAQTAEGTTVFETYEIGGIRISGNENSETALLLTVAGLRVGDRIRMPGPERHRRPGEQPDQREKRGNPHFQ